jgi:hypothetical protein
MNVIRITSADQVLQFWDVFREGLHVIRDKADEYMDESEYCRLLTNLAARTDVAWIGVVCSGGPICYGVAQDSTPPHSSRRTFTVSSFYHVPGQADATQLLMVAFEQWFRETNPGKKLRYVVTTRRDSGAAIRCFRSGRYGFRKGYIAFEKLLN